MAVGIRLVHHTGGLIDTVKEGFTGFSFKGDGLDDTIEDMVVQFDACMDVFFNDKPKWKRMQKKAKAVRFSWEDSVKEYYKTLYTV